MVNKETREKRIVLTLSIVSTIIVFSIGLMIGAYFEMLRATKVELLRAKAEIEILDLFLQKDLSLVDCKAMVESVIETADRIYFQAKIIEKYEEYEKISNTLKILHRRYDLLRTMLWIQLINIKKECKNTPHTLIYLYKFHNPSIEQMAKQNAFSKLLREVKESQGNSVILIPIAADMNLTSLDMLLKTYNVTKLPTVLIDEKVKLTELVTADELIRIINETS